MQPTIDQAEKEALSTAGLERRPIPPYKLLSIYMARRIGKGQEPQGCRTDGPNPS